MTKLNVSMISPAPGDDRGGEPGAKPTPGSGWLAGRPVIALDDEKPIELIARGGDYKRGARVIGETEYPGGLLSPAVALAVKTRHRSTASGSAMHQGQSDLADSE